MLKNTLQPIITSFGSVAKRVVKGILNFFATLKHSIIQLSLASCSFKALGRNTDPFHCLELIAVAFAGLPLGLLGAVLQCGQG